ncbi:MAG: ribosome small subunit-dependent GTPase A [Bacteroidales bacterium]|nr:ribosome small subunit-dependent GTPase A [Candidatus Cacconaster merdequi]
METKGTATVVKHTGSHYLLSELPVWNPFPAVIRGKVRLESSRATNPVAVGDVIEYNLPADGGDGMATISRILPRRNGIIRKSTNLSRESHIIAANIDKVFLITTMILPETKLEFVDRFLVCCEAYQVHPVILVNKTDLYDEPDLQAMLSHFIGIYRGAGYQVLEISVADGRGIDEVKDMCKDSICLFSGASGVGKSSLLKALDPSLNPKIGDISTSHLQGKHTTTFYEMHPLSCGGFVIDTPGIRGFGLVDIEDEELSTYFPEMLKITDNCRFKPCTHTHEPGCAVKQAVDDGLISPERYCSYLGMLQEETKYR